MKLITKTLKDRFEKVGPQDEKRRDAIVIARFFCPWSDWEWYATEYDETTNECFGLVSGTFVELGYFNIDELESIEGPLALKIERDKYWQEKTVGQIEDSLVKSRILTTDEHLNINNP